jgi:hypothetical protein
MSACTVNGVVIPCCVFSRPCRLPLISPTRLYVHGVLTPSQLGFVGCDPAKWSPSSTVKTKSVLLLLIPSSARRWKNCPKAWSYLRSCST